MLRLGQKWLPLAMLAALLAMALCLPTQGGAGVRSALELCGGQLIPALFPFLVVTNLLVGSAQGEAFGLLCVPTARLLGLKKRIHALALFLCWAGGFAVGASCIAQLYRQRRITAAEAQQLLVAGICSGPGFVVGSVGALMLGSERQGALLAVALLGGNFLCGLVLRPVLRRTPAPQSSYTGDTQEPALPNVLSGFVPAVRGAVDSMLAICGFVLLFGFLRAALTALFPLQGYAQLALAALLEVTSGCQLAAALPGRLFLCCATLSVLSLSVFLQVRFLLPAELSLRPLFLSRFLHLPLSLLLLRLLLRIFPDSGSVYSTLAPRLLLRQRTRLDTALVLLFLCCAFLRAIHPILSTKK